ncbi:tRNA glutamyl-Q(34) synthetase GluQRS [Salinarimonas ramus]|uniref:tRNA glutamyl-Q(34) synthetase GluQRS n=1 Tax=Salinarimonas ramus TaxID=690164 RepID=A0A917Q6R6_9HYPH|nr:tRNA glutamyl-Q(34) synthetase GluQRS [Salinarimonas ramus]GGK31794.1 tRNA glutamyl-Q(34) synthetase GluQRS [Salinarimonas ramus]
MTQPVFRFAPSPNGRLHLGHAFSALENARLAARFGGRLLLRIEDIDTTRCREDLVAAMIDDLAWLGLPFEPEPLRQSLRFPLYEAAADRLRGMGLLYPCICSRKEIAAAVAAREAESGRPSPRDPDGAPLYPGTCRARDPAAVLSEAAREGLPIAWRLDMARALAAVPGPFVYERFAQGGEAEPVHADPARWGDAVIVRKEIPTSYHLAVVVDDAAQGVTHVVRGQDLEAATDLHVLLQRCLDLPTPLYLHHGLVRDEAGEKLAKSLGSKPLAELRAAGWTPADVRAALYAR